MKIIDFFSCAWLGLWYAVGMKEKEIEIGSFVVLNNGKTVVVDEAFEGGFWGSDSDGESYEFTVGMVNAVCP